MPSSSLVPINDPTVLLTTAGMQQMTPYFLGLEAPPHNRLCSVQKCFRTVDIEEVGDESHSPSSSCSAISRSATTSSGSRCAWSWEFLTEVMGLPAERLYPTVHPDDADAYAIWRDEIGVPEERIGKLSDNWWGPVGNSGPNGPDSEIYFDLGPEAGDTANGSRRWQSLSRGLEQRLHGVFAGAGRFAHAAAAAACRYRHGTRAADDGDAGRQSIYDIDLYQTIIREGRGAGRGHLWRRRQDDRSLRVIADHIRGSAFLIADGVLPGNEGRSYVLRRILRRAIKNGRQLGLDKPFLADLAKVVIAAVRGQLPGIADRRSQIEKVLMHEEQTFGRTLTTGMSRFQALADSDRGERWFCRARR